MASAQISSTTRPAYLWTGSEWIPIGDGTFSGSKIIVSSTPPENPVEGDVWFDNTDGSFYVYDGSFWVEPAFIGAGGEGGGVSNETIRDVAASLFNHNLHTNLTVFYDDPNDKVLLTVLQDVLSVNGASGNVILTTSEIDEGTNLYFTDQRAIDATELEIQSASSSLISYIDEKDLELSEEIQSASASIFEYVDDTFLPLSGGTLSGDLSVEGSFTVSGSTVLINATDLAISDPLIYMAVGQWDTDLLDTGFLSAYGEEGGTEENHLHRGLVFDQTDDKWKLISNVPHPENNFVDFDNAEYETMKLGILDVEDINALGVVSASAFIGDGSQLTGIVSLPEQSGNNGNFLTTDGSVASWAVIGQLPTGGTTGQYLVKNSSTNFDASWANLVVPDEAPHPFLLMGG